MVTILLIVGLVAAVVVNIAMYFDNKIGEKAALDYCLVLAMRLKENNIPVPTYEEVIEQLRRL